MGGNPGIAPQPDGPGNEAARRMRELAARTHADELARARAKRRS